MCSRPGSIRHVRRDRVARGAVKMHELTITENVIAAVTERVGSENVVRVQWLIGKRSGFAHARDHGCV